MEPDHEPEPGFAAHLGAGVSCTRLLAHPREWINRRVETVELLAREDTRRRVSVDFTLSDSQFEELEIADGVVVPISVLSKEPRRNFDLRDESGRALPVLGRHQNAELTLIAVMSAAVDALPDGLGTDVVEPLTADLRQVIYAPAPDAGEALALFVGGAERGDHWRDLVWQDDTCRSLLTAMWRNYALFAVLPPGGPNRRVLKFSYAEDFAFERQVVGLRERFAPRTLAWRAWRPDRERFLVECPSAWRALSFHVEIAVPEELRIETAVLYDFDADELVSDRDSNVNRASLYARDIEETEAVEAYVQVAPERSGRTSQAAATSIVVAALLWLGVASGLDVANPGPAVSILLAGAALFSGVAAVQGEHALTKRVFAAPRRWLLLATAAGLGGSATLAMEIPNQHPVALWRIAAGLATLAAARLVWSGVRAPL